MNVARQIFSDFEAASPIYFYSLKAIGLKGKFKS